MAWSNWIIQEAPVRSQSAPSDPKRQVAAAIASRLQDGDIVGVGSGSTCRYALEEIGRRVNAEGLRCTIVPTSAEMAFLASSFRIPTTSLRDVRPDWCFDGADEVDREGNFLKGRGGAIFKEKLVMAASPRIFIVIDRSKLVDRLGRTSPVAIEVHPDAVHIVHVALSEMGATNAILRPAGGKDGPVVTENGNFLLDARFPEVPLALEKQIKAVTGVIECGICSGNRAEILLPEGGVST